SGCVLVVRVSRLPGLSRVDSLSLRDALPISPYTVAGDVEGATPLAALEAGLDALLHAAAEAADGRPRQACGDERDHEDEQESDRSEEHTSELQSRENLVCRLLLEKNKAAESS